jgi:transcriptional regulator CBF1
MQAAPVNIQQQPPDDGAPDQGQSASVNSVDKDGSDSPSAPGTTTANAGGRRSARSATMGTDEWSRQRKDNHVSVFFSLLGNVIWLTRITERG